MIHNLLKRAGLIIKIFYGRRQKDNQKRQMEEGQAIQWTKEK
jgi:hypothetical protein